MSSGPFATVAAVVGMAASAAATGPLSEVFNELGLTMAICGAMGGGARFLILRRAQRTVGLVAAAIEGSALIALGAVLAFGLGIVAPPILSAAFGLNLAPDGGSTAALGAGAFLIGIAGERALAKLGLVEKPGGDDA